MGEDGLDAVYRGYVGWRRSMVASLDDMITEICGKVIEGEQRNGETVKVVEHRGYFPYFYRYCDGDWRYVKAEELEKFLARYLDGSEVLRLLALAERRNNALVLWGHMHRLLVELGIVEE
jgi:hypothetical protein